jgi:hypothetical protein
MNKEQILERIQQIKARLNQATPGPWYVNFLDDEFHMNLVAVTTRPDSGKHEALPYEDPEKEILNFIVATTLRQSEIGREDKDHKFVEVDFDNELWDEDAEFIANAPSDIQFLIDLAESFLKNS